MTETAQSKLSEAERSRKLAQIKQTVIATVRQFIAGSETPLVNLTEDHLGWTEEDWFETDRWMSTTLSATNMIGVQNGNPGGYDMVLPDQNEELFRALQQKLIEEIRALGFKAERGTLIEQYFRVDLI